MSLFLSREDARSEAMSSARHDAETAQRERDAFIARLATELAKTAEREMKAAGLDYSDWHKSHASETREGSKRKSVARTPMAEMAHDFTDLLDNIIEEAPDPDEAASDARELYTETEE